MDIHQLCARLKERVAADLQQVSDPRAEGEILIAAFYEVSRSVLVALGSPGKSPQYLQGQGAVLELISFLAIRLIRGAVPERRGVAVLSELREGCLDPQLKKVLSVYAQELLAKSSPHPPPPSRGQTRAWLAGLTALAALALCFASLRGPDRRMQAPLTAAAPAVTPAPSEATPAPVAVSSPPAYAGEGGRRQPSEPPLSPSGQLSSQGEQTTRVRIVNNQVLVPVTIENQGQSVSLELLLDTGATRTALHDRIKSRLPIDLHEARSSQAELADGRVIVSRLAVVDALLVGPHALASAELQFIPFHGGEARHDGLLGMDFLGSHRYQIDMEHELIRWF